VFAGEFSDDAALPNPQPLTARGRQRNCGEAAGGVRRLPGGLFCDPWCRCRGCHRPLSLALTRQPTELDDGMLTTSEVAQLKLDADWVVLSHCNTAAADKPGAEAPQPRLPPTVAMPAQRPKAPIAA
jgi:hypothetical protein